MRVLNNNLNIPQKGDYLALSLNDREVLYNHLNNFINLMDDLTLKELGDGCSNDINNLFDGIILQ